MSWYWSNRDSVAAFTERTGKATETRDRFVTKHVEWETWEMYSKFLSENLCMKSHLDDAGVDVKKVLSLILKDYGLGVRIGLMLLRIVIVGALLVKA